MLYASVDDSVTVDSWSWSGPNGFNSSLQNPEINNASTLNSGLYTLTTTASNGCTSSRTLSVEVNRCFFPFNVKAFLEGPYIGFRTMLPTLYGLGLSTESNATDYIQIELWSPDSLSGESGLYETQTILRTNGTSTINVPYQLIGRNLYLVIKHRNSIETWSANPVLLTDAGTYDFTNNANKAYSDGTRAAMKRMQSGNVFALYSGDINQDGTIDGSDMNEVDNNTILGAYGYDASDVNGDGATDGLDMNIVDNNTGLGLYFARPY
jgi:hypothetical protein